MANILDGRLVSDSVLATVQKDVEALQAEHIHPKLAVILVGEDLGSLSYVRQKEKSCEATGVLWEQISYASTVEQAVLEAKIDELNTNPEIHGILIQLPLPQHLNVPVLLKRINPDKDVDGFHAYNVGKMFLSKEFEGLVPCTPKGVIKMLEYYNLPIEGQDVTVVGHSNIVGKPMTIMMLNRDATVTTCHIHTKDLAANTKRADILIVAVGRPNLITADMVKDGAVVVDIGCNRVDGKLCGDVDFDEIAKKASYITPVPGGAGPMTVACLMENVVIAAKRQNNQS
ncbi:bifunctional methylenetetrahydrofolate dehydrogenase/methenyltetrahydrofolate cyclohydrolase [Candidatus Peregrinibacteria bacterium CG11_big_fil_rev_8_21_14_0_20_41_10]|nr:MAG: bifunctional methylenetetrahydrofolate dehydrogenase/methenyltetrahydrofolate cyclohydrolase [Candidatus Peregrinibacteria bacterium CG11_big_fil_rev_8_21_14_0_20_41_10]PIZ74716.1 MAG: bifunctional methylenetetrahydrofolate dehydrogenase/methenyltetrahydrofolate cyclohydrolase [Candidatus Peregrinibacteria bacterium CG_4_10_14_0_2_um_filter_41_8]PJC37907.1 MAG: bifunctional methylenetetrahydrofolate dehydrogenase/methenyltetrahydrofolate cyclohydrolase [Candidatus Peregrinibacteria bacter